MRIGIAHVGGLYTVPYGSGTQVADGANAIWNAGFRSIKMYLTGDYTGDYRLQTAWSSTPTTLTQLAQTTQMATQLGRGWTVVMLTVFPFCTTDFSRPVGQRITNYWRVSFTTAQKQATYTEMYNLGCHLLSTYNGTGTEFRLQNWEGDWAFMDAFVSETPVNRYLVNQYLAFLGTRQKAIADARRDTPSDCKLLMAYEANKTLEARLKPHLRRLFRDMADKLQPDVISLSAYDFMIDTAIGFGADYATWAAYTLPLCAKALRQTQLRFPGVPIQIGETGFPEVQAAGLGRDIGDMIRAVAAVCVTYGVSDFVYWQVFDNEDAGQFSTNFALSSNTIGDGNYLQQTNTSLTVTLNNATAPDGTTTATKIDFGAVTSGQYSQVIQPIGGCVNGQVHTFTVYLRAASALTVYLWIYDTNQNSVAQACSVTTTWQRFQLTYTGTATGSWIFQIGNNRFGLTTSADTPAQTAYAWGEQVERRATATPLIKTSATSLSGNTRGYYTVKPDGSVSVAGVALAGL